MGPTKLETLNLKTLDSGLFFFFFFIFFFFIFIFFFFFSSLGSCYQNTQYPIHLFFCLLPSICLKMNPKEIARIRIMLGFYY
jgi:hypothetical protein